MSTYVDPIRHRLSKHFLLSDFMGCNSVYKGLCNNRIKTDEVGKLAEASKLCTEVLEPIVEELGSISITYGFISDKLSHEIVKYQNPKKPSYHRWDLGAAADFIPHSWVYEDQPPVIYAAHIDDHLPEYARMITYSESPCICIATSIKEANRRAFYENRYQGHHGDKPKFITYSKATSSRQSQKDTVRSMDLSEWRGQGYPSYHGGRSQQTHHIRLGRYSMLSDFLYSRDAVHKGIANLPDMTNNDIAINFIQAARVYDTVVDKFGRCSIVKAYESRDVRHRCNRDFSSRWVMDLVPPEGTDVYDICNYLGDTVHLDTTKDNRITIWG